jgi:hypothetical protein
MAQIPAQTTARLSVGSLTLPLEHVEITHAPVIQAFGLFDDLWKPVQPAAYSIKGQAYPRKIPVTLRVGRTLFTVPRGSSCRVDITITVEPKPAKITK